MKSLYWYGARESDINDTGDLFEASITLFGESENNISFCDESPIRINHNIINDEQDNFTIKQLLALHKRDKQAKIMFYNPKIFYNYKRLRSLRECIVCLNEEEILRKTDDKITFREMMGKDVSFLNSIVAEGKNCNIDMFREKLHGGDSFVIQCPVSCGGNGTYVIRKYIPENIKEIINNQNRCLVTKFQEYSVPVNLHAIIYNRSIIFSPGSVQIVRETDSRLIYRGADFFTYKKLKPEQQKLFKEQSYKICERLQSMGYRGVLGIDGLITPDGQVYIMEINNRFQASTPLINKALNNEGRPSLHKMNLDAFMGIEPSGIELELEQVDVPYSCYIYVAGENDFHSYHVLDHCEKCVDEIVSDGFKNDQAREANAYLFKLIFKTNITSLSPNGHVLVYENIAGPSRRYYDKIMEKTLLL